MPLTDQEIKKIKPQDKAQKLFDGGGLFLLVTPQGGKCWRMKYRFAGKEKLLSLGTYPEISLKDARSRREDARKQLAQGSDPSAMKRIAKIKAKVQAGETFDALADEFLKVKGPSLADATIAKKKEILKNHLRPWLGTRPVKEITAPELLAAIRRIESRGANELAHKALGLVGQILRYAVATGRAERCPTSDLRGALTPVSVSHHPAITDPKRLGELLRAIDGYDGPIVRAALKLAPRQFRNQRCRNTASIRY